jgi:hypothetical protein
MPVTSARRAFPKRAALCACLVGLLLAGDICLFTRTSCGEDFLSDRRVYTTRRADTPPRIDGLPDDPVWDTVDWSGDFTQRVPTEGEEPTAQTFFKILYDDENLYVAYQADDPEPEKIAAILDRRDNFPGDWIEINIDSHHDYRTAFSFTASVSGTQGDEFISDDGDNWDSSWDPVWEHEACINHHGWTAEVRIPLSQLRYADCSEQVWGIQIQRRLHRNEERSTWQEIPKDEDGWVSKFGELRGICGIRPQRRVELLPYAVSRAERFEGTPDDPFHDGSREHFAGGLDGKIGVTGDLTLDLTINPDFGQVEADPSEVNLTAFETFFTEKRPFFIEGSDILDFRIAPSIAFGSHTTDRLFYSRRIGRPPHYRADSNEDGFVDQPDNTTILSAFKLCGKTSSGVSLALLESVTAREQARVEDGGERRDVTVEPLTNYFVGRVQKDYREGRTRLGGIFTAVNRDIDVEQLDTLHRSAYAGGVDFHHYLIGRRYYMAARLVGSQVRGSREAILETQTAPARYYQRPDNTGQSVDSTRTSLSGHSGSLMFGKSEGALNFQGGAAWRSAGFEINDVGYVRNSDEINEFSWAGYYVRNPIGIFRSMGFNFNQWLDFEYDSGENLYQAFNHNGYATFTNKWNVNWSFTRENERISNYELRGGPSMALPGDWQYNANINSDWNRPVAFNLGLWGSVHDDDSGWERSYWTTVSWRATSALGLSLNPSFSHRRPELQYVTICGGDSPQFVYGRMHQRTFDLSFRVDLALSPRLTLQYYGAPFVSAGRYDDFKRITEPRADAYGDRFVRLGEAAHYDAATGEYSVDEDGDGVSDYSFGDPGFNVRDFNSNLVLRWEYSPGSSLYLVWQQARSGTGRAGEFALQDDLDGLFGAHPHNIFLLKMNRWLSF